LASAPCLPALSDRIFVSLAVALLCCPAAPAQSVEPPPLRLDGVVPSGVRASATESWGAFTFNLTNSSDTDRQARVLLSYVGAPDVQYGRDVWVPARSTLATWMLVGPVPPAVEHGPRLLGNAREIEVVLTERSQGKERLILPPGEERIRSRGVL